MKEYKNKEMVREFLKNEYKVPLLELYRLSDATDKDGNVAGFRIFSLRFISSCFATISKDLDEAIDIMEVINNNSEHSVYKIKKYKNYYLVLD
jgi:hypothetical protein